MTTSEITFRQAELDRFGAKVDALVTQLTAEEQLLLTALLAKGMEGVRDDMADVAGFKLPGLRKVPTITLKRGITGGGATVAGDGSVLTVSGDPLASVAIAELFAMP